MFCTGCGLQLPEQGRFCPKCGRPVAGQAPPPAVSPVIPAPVPAHVQPAVQPSPAPGGPANRKGSTKKWVALTLTPLVLLGLVAGGYFLWFKEGSSSSDGFAPIPMVRSAVKAPTEAWTVELPSIAQGLAWTGDVSTRVVVVDDAVVVEADRVGTFIGQVSVIDIATGKLRWSSGAHESPGGCTAFEDLLVCRVQELTDFGGHLIAYDMKSGRVRFTTPSEPNFQYQIAGAIYTASETRTNEEPPTATLLTKYSADGTKLWTNSDLYLPSSTGYAGLAATSDSVARTDATTSDGRAFVLDASTGRLAEDRPKGMVRSEPVEGYWAADASSSDNTFTVRGRTIGSNQVDVQGVTRLFQDGVGRPVAAVLQSSVDQTNTSVYSFSGHESTRRFRTTGWLSGFCGDQALVFRDGGLAALDATNGTTTWADSSAGRAVTDWRCAGSGDALLVAVDPALRSSELPNSSTSQPSLMGLNLFSGAELWSAPLTQLRNMPDDDLLVAMGEQGVAVLAVSSTDTPSAQLTFLKAN